MGNVGVYQKHGSTHTRLYRIWGGMKSRCYIPSASGYEHYGGKGIVVCDEWLNFQAFKDWAITSGYNDDLSIERLDRDGNYEPRNCAWIPLAKQKSNTSQNIFITLNGETHTAAEWSRKLNIKESTIRYRYRQGMPAEKILDVIDRRSNPVNYGKTPIKQRTLRLKEEVINDASEESQQDKKTA